LTQFTYKIALRIVQVNYLVDNNSVLQLLVLLHRNLESFLPMNQPETLIP
jgi:hypothetical protein